MTVHRLTLASLTSLCALAGAFALTSPPAQALYFHRLESSITEIPATGPHGETVLDPGSFGELNAVTVDSGHLWVAEKVVFQQARIDEFNAETGAFEQQFPHTNGESSHINGYISGVAVGHSMGETQVYVSYSSGEVRVFSESGALLGTWTGADTPSKSFAAADSVAVDNNNELADPDAGDVYVTDGPDHVVDVFRPEADGKEKYVTQG